MLTGHEWSIHDFLTFFVVDLMGDGKIHKQGHFSHKKADSPLLFS